MRLRRVSPHRWEEQRPGEPTRHGCLVCGSERFEPEDGAVLYRRPEDREFSSTLPPCVRLRGRHIDHGNPENARRALRACGSGEKRRGTARCPGCGYAWTSVNEARRFFEDCRALEAEGSDEDRALLEAVAPLRPSRRTRRKNEA